MNWLTDVMLVTPSFLKLLQNSCQMAATLLSTVLITHSFILSRCFSSLGLAHFLNMFCHIAPASVCIHKSRFCFLHSFFMEVHFGCFLSLFLLIQRASSVILAHFWIQKKLHFNFKFCFSKWKWKLLTIWESTFLSRFFSIESKVILIFFESFSSFQQTINYYDNFFFSKYFANFFLQVFYLFLEVFLMKWDHCSGSVEMFLLLKFDWCSCLLI